MVKATVEPGGELWVQEEHSTPQTGHDLKTHRQLPSVSEARSKKSAILFHGE